MSTFYRSRNVLVTGGGGFVGSHLVERLLDAGANVRVAQRRRPEKNLGGLLNRVEFVQADLLNVDDCARAARDMDVTFDLAATIGGVRENSAWAATMFYRNAVPALHMLEASRNAGVERYLCSSSTSVYPPATAIPNGEEDGWTGSPDEAHLGYGWAKRFAELGAQLYARDSGMKIAMDRCGNVYGPRDSFESESVHVIPALIRKTFESTGVLEVWGSGHQVRSFVYVKDVAEAMMLLTEKYAVADPVNIGGSQEVTIRHLVELVLRISGKRLHVRFVGDKPEGQLRKSASLAKVKEKLGWAPLYTLESGLIETIRWFREVVHA